ncbi:MULTISPECIES: hypothetical protein [unclassified Streptomyces]|uniref:hypothetical protein n=1 Tax=unclassified Streptomyces TaxID=2593676 RepID=UPI002DDA8BCF|nr:MULTISPECIES: hypothetical protein [unclassified Streptomyces]WSA95704.1 hypothetical protein OIE63_32200 [Streptomyces sp. NBC_01795]WSB80123.1 hypothetical protein OHB04_33315 [Streptomyces sp. NBC_01775]WSS11669.1 hypothetical protein OG533_06895 [Streptomyces sp. NBC_01186]WSS40382.1 hypothetical protein OG220_07040 [Streptomyces sp. NBC_01187]
MLKEPRSGRLAAWGNALLAGLVSPDEAVERIVEDDTRHRMLLPEPDAGEAGLTLALGRLRALGASGLRVALPVPGHPLGLSGPPEFNARAVEAEEAVLVHGAALGLVPAVYESGPPGGGAGPEDVHTEVVWECLPVREAPPADVPSLGEAERELAEAMRDATQVLTRLDVAGSGPVADAALEAYRARLAAGRQLLAPGYPPRAVRVLELAQRVGALVSIAYGDGGDGRAHGGAVSAAEMAARSEALRPVERTARRAQVAAYNAYAEEMERRQEEGLP